MDIFSGSFLAGLIGGIVGAGIFIIIARIRAQRRYDKNSFSLPLGIRRGIPSKRALLSSVPIGIGLVVGRTMLWANPAMTRLVGYGPGEYYRKDSRLLYPDDDEYQRVGTILTRSLQELGEAEVESVLKRKDGSLVPCLFHAVRLTETSEGPLNIIAITDISVPKGMQEALREKGEKYHTIFERLPVGIFRSTVSSGFLEVNQTLAALFGYENSEEMLRNVKNIPSLFSDPHDYTAMVQKTSVADGMHRFEILFRRRDGSTFPGEMLARAVRSEEGEIRYIEGIIEDVGERKNSEEQIRQYQSQLEAMVADRTKELEDSLLELRNAKAQLIEAERLASLGSLVGGITHEINNPVGVALTASSHLTTRVNETTLLFKDNNLTRKDFEDFLDTAGEASDIIQRNLERAREFISDIKQVAVDQSSEQSRQFNLSEYLKTVVTSLRPVLKRSCATVAIDCENNLYIESFPGALSHVLTNLIMNSLIHAFEGREKGEILIRVEKENSLLRMIIRDDGTGMSPDIRNQIFTPYFTTKHDRGGTGLGLHITRTTVTDILKGTIEVVSEPGKGTSFTITFPARIVSPT